MKNNINDNSIKTNVKDLIDFIIIMLAVILSFYLKLKLVDFIIFLIIVWSLLKTVSREKMLALSVLCLIFGAITYATDRINFSDPAFELSFVFFSIGVAISLKEYLIETKKQKI